jgi:hypothetical protein
MGPYFSFLTPLPSSLPPSFFLYCNKRGRDLGGNTEGGVPYAAAALSLVLHSANPHLPTFRSDVRYFECQVGREGGREHRREGRNVIKKLPRRRRSRTIIWPVD